MSIFATSAALLEPPLAVASEPILARFVLDGTACVVMPSDAATTLACVGALEVGGRQYVIAQISDESLADPLDLLTPRELQIALLIAAGHESKVVARRLHISFHTVRVHLGRIYVKLRLHKQTELACLISARYGLFYKKDYFLKPDCE